jgi:hypothetical protein
MAEDNRPLINKIFNPYPNLPGLKGLDLTGGKRYFVGSDKGLSSIFKDYTDPNITVGETLLKGLGSVGDLGLETILGIYDTAMRAPQGLLSTPYNVLTAKSPIAKDVANVSDALKIPELPNATLDEIININKMSRNPDLELRQLEEESPYTDDDYETGKGMADTIQKNLNLGMGDDETFGLTEVAKEPNLGMGDDETFGLGETNTTKADDKKKETKKQSLDDLVNSSAESFLKSLEGDDFKVRSLDEYKKDFADATGLDTSGKADKSTALMALGLALMQNKAGKGFNVSNILSEVGKAGEAALPALEKAKTEAKQAQLAAGQYALQSRDRDTADKKSRLTELATYKRNRRDTLSDYYRQLGDQKAVDYIKHQYDKELKYIDYAQDKLTADAKGQEFKSIYQDKLLPGNEQVKVGYGFIGTEPKFINPTVDATQVTQQYIKGQRALTSLDKLDGLLASLESEQSPAGTILFDRGKSVLSALGIGKPEEWFGKRGISRESEAQAIINVLIQENKRFITQETGNGVSEGDKEDIKNVLGRIELTKNPRENRLIIAELRGIFDNPMTVLENQVTSFLDDKNKYVDNQTYQNTVSEIENLLGGAQNVLQQTEFDVSE